MPENIFDDLTHLDDIWLHRNNITEFPKGIFKGLVKLRLMSLNNNQLSTLPEGIFGSLANLRSVALDENNFVNVPPELFSNKNFPNRSEVLFYGNPLSPEAINTLKDQLGDRFNFDEE